jgi:hypothetical protein
MAFVLQREVINEDNSEVDAAGVTIIETRGQRHRIEFSVDHINNQPKIAHRISRSSIKVGTKVTVEWPPKWNWGEWRADQFKSLARSYAWLNPHLTLLGRFNGEVFVDVTATDRAWKKWNPRNPTSAHCAAPRISSAASICGSRSRRHLSGRWRCFADAAAA